MKTQQLILAGIFVGISITILYLSSILPTNQITLLTLASFIVPATIISISLKASFLVYFSTFLLGLLILPKNTIILYGLFFGFYGILKYIIEKAKNLFIELSIKLVFFNFSLLLMYYISKSLLSNVVVTFPLSLLWIIAQIIFIIYDYALTILISFYVKKIAKYMAKSTR